MNGAEAFGKRKDSIMLKVTAASLQQFVQACAFLSVQKAMVQQGLNNA